MSNDQPEIIETIEPPSDAEIVDFIGGNGGNPDYHTILEVWQKVLEPAEEDSKRKVGMPWAARIVGSNKEVGFGDVNAVRDSLHAKISELQDILDLEIDSDPTCFEHTSMEEDREKNAHHYKNLLILWQCAFVKWEHDWDTGRADAAVEIAALSEAQAMFFGDKGLTQHLGEINLEYTEADQEDLALALSEFRDSLDDGLAGE